MNVWERPSSLEWELHIRFIQVTMSVRRMVEPLDRHKYVHISSTIHRVLDGFEVECANTPKLG